MNNKPTERQQSRRKLLRLITASILIAGCYILSLF